MSLREVIAQLDVQVRGLGVVRQANAELDAYVGTVTPAISRIEALRIKQAEHAEMVTRLTARLRQLQAAEGDNSREILDTRVAIQRASAASRGYAEQVQQHEQTQRSAARSSISFRDVLSSLADVTHIARAAFDVARAAAQAFWSQIEEIISSGSRLADLSQQLSVSSTRLQEWDFIATQSGATLETITRGLDQVARTAGRGADVYGRLGVATRRAGGELRSQEEILDDTLSALAGVESSTERAALAQQVFGRGAREMLGIVNEGPESLDELRRRFRELGGGMSEDGVRAAADAGDAMDELQVAMRSLRDTLAPVVLPAITALVQTLASGVGRLVEWAQSTSLLSNAMILATAFTEDWWEQMRAIGTGLAVISAPVIAFVLIVDDLMTALRGGRSEIGSLVEEFAQAQGHTLTFLGVIDSLRIGLLDMRNAALAAAEAVMTVVPGAGDALAQVRAARTTGEAEVSRARAQLATDESARFAERAAFARQASLRSDDPSKRAAAEASVQMQTTVHVTAADPEAAGRAVAREQRRDMRRAADALGRAPVPA